MMLLLAALFSTSCFGTPSWTIEQLVEQIRAESEIAQAAEKDLKAIELEIRSRDLLLGLQLTGEAASVEDNRDQVTFARRTEYKFLNFSLVKPFSTGTTVSVTGAHDDSVYATLGPRNNEFWEARITQSLWRDFFGRGTDLRHQAERAELVSRKANTYYGLQNFLINVENIYWDLSLALREFEIRQRNIQNGRRLETWTRRRARNSAAERSDVLQAQSLVSQATLELINAQNQIENLKNQLRQSLPGATADIEVDLSSLEKPRPVTSLIVRDDSTSSPRRLDTLSAAFLAKQAEAEAQQLKESLRPRVDAYVSYGQNGIAPTFDAAWDRTMDSDHNISKVGVVISVDLNRGLVADRVRAAQLGAQARVLQAQAQNRLSAIGWEELQRQIKILHEQAEEASRLSILQNRKVIEERERFRLGRSTVFQMVTYELDAANAELGKYRALAALRKAESQARLFATLDGGSL